MHSSTMKESINVYMGYARTHKGRNRKNPNKRMGFLAYEQSQKHWNKANNSKRKTLRDFR